MVDIQPLTTKVNKSTSLILIVNDIKYKDIISPGFDEVVMIAGIGLPVSSLCIILQLPLTPDGGTKILSLLHYIYITNMITHMIPAEKKGLKQQMTNDNAIYKYPFWISLI